ncbi:trypsin-like peptidase domain-containing protein [Vibrio sp. IB15]|uniref:ABC-three component system protein n=1 Tax=Vibrio sp. IB15 TaxID=2779368 RepID=UPI0018E702CC|nr:ABC-three component system protein [Vibrio sp. IB15]MBJ2147935.1 trypsin-like peptidase domain-containing protein [Vibrio sp. IB15]
MSHEADLIRKNHSVKVNNGSGVFIQPMSSEYGYVLTARHCLKVDSNDLNSANIDPHVVTKYDGSVIDVLDFVEHDTEDMAILIVKPDVTLDLRVSSKQLVTNENVFLCGYPEDRDFENCGYSNYIYKMHNYKEIGKVILSPQDTVDHSNVLGFSGGGIFTLGNEDSPVLLCAIETKMDGNISREYHGRIEAILISEFEKLIENSKKRYLGKQLSPLLPLHLSSFDHLVDFTFTVQRGWADDDGLTLLQQALRSVVSEKFKVNLYPHEILTQLHNFFYVYERPKYELRCRELWSAFLELLIISIIIDEPVSVDMEYIRNMLKSKRLIYIGESGVWREYIKNILFTDLDNLNDNGIIVAQTLSKSHMPKFKKEFVKSVWNKSNIGRVQNDIRNIRVVNSKISKINSVVDLTALHCECIESKEEVYDKYTDKNFFDTENEKKIIELLASQYKPYLTVEGVESES